MHFTTVLIAGVWLLTFHITPALTRMSLLNKGYDTEYVDAWCETLAVSDEQRAMLQFYTALFCVNFMGELGRAFNRQRPAAPVPQQLSA